MRPLACAAVLALLTLPGDAQGAQGERSGPPPQDQPPRDPQDGGEELPAGEQGEASPPGPLPALAEESTDVARGPSGSAPATGAGAPRIDHRLSAAEIQAGVGELARAFPERVRVQTLGKSALGREIPLLVLSDPGRPYLEKPAILLVAFGSAAETGDGEFVPGDSELALGACWSLLSGDPPRDDPFAGATLYVVPLLDPDARDAGADPPDPEGVRIDRNFPMGWLPASLRPGAGDVPLVRPEGKALVQFLGVHRNAVLVLVARATPAPSAPSGSGEGTALGARPFATPVPAADRDALARLEALAPPSGRPRLVAFDARSTPGGGLLEYAYEALGILPLALEQGETLPAGAEPVAWAAAGSEVVAGLLASLPRLSLSVQRLENLAPGTWQIDLALRNTGALPAMSALGRERRGDERPRLTLSGARAIAVAHRSAGEERYRAATLAPAADGSIPLPLVLDGGASEWIRLIVEAQSASELALSVRSSWVGRAELALRLP